MFLKKEKEKKKTYQKIQTMLYLLELCSPVLRETVQEVLIMKRLRANIKGRRGCHCVWRKQAHASGALSGEGYVTVRQTEMLTLTGCQSCSLFFLSGIRLHLVDRLASLEYDDIQVWNDIVSFVLVNFGSLVIPFLILTAIDTAENSHFGKPEGRITYLKNIEAELTQFYQRNL